MVAHRHRQQVRPFTDVTRPQFRGLSDKHILLFPKVWFSAVYHVGRNSQTATACDV